MDAWRETGRKAARYLGTSVTAPYLRRGDIVLGFHLEPVAVVESAPVPHPTEKGWHVLKLSNGYSVGSHVMTDGEAYRIGRVPLTNTDRDAYAAVLGTWEAPCGCVVNKGEHCEECGPYNGASPMCMNRVRL